MDLVSDVDQLSNQLIKRRMTICTAESCTGGLISKLFTDKPGSSQWFDCGFISYTNAAKISMLNVDSSLLNDSGAVSRTTVEAMSEGAIEKSSASISCAVSGIAGPDGGSKEKPIGMVWIAWAGQNHLTESQCFYFKGDRESIRNQAASSAIKGAVKFIVKNA